MHIHRRHIHRGHVHRGHVHSAADTTVEFAAPGFAREDIARLLVLQWGFRILVLGVVI